MRHEAQEKPRPKPIQLLRLFVFVVALSLVSNLVVWLSGWSLLYVLLAVNTVGFLILFRWKSWRARHEQAAGQTA